MSALRVISRLGQLALLPLLSACVSGGTLQSVETNCASRFPTYADAWSCARNQRAGSYDEYRTRYLATEPLGGASSCGGGQSGRD